MAVFNLRFRTLSGQTYRLTVKSTDSIQTVTSKLLQKILEKNTELDPSRTTIRLSYMNDGEMVELMNSKQISDYPDLASLKTDIVVAIDSERMFTIYAMAPNGMVTIRVSPSDTIFEVKKKLYRKFLEDSFYKTYGSAVFNMSYKGRPMLDYSLPLSRYPTITQDSVLDLDMDDTQYYTDIHIMVGKYQVDTLQEKVPFNYLMTGSELRSLLTSPEINPSKEYILRIGRENGAIIEDDAYLFQYPTMECDSNLYLSYVKNNSNSNSNSNSNRNSNRNSMYSNWGGRRITKRKSLSNRKSRRGRKLH